METPLVKNKYTYDSKTASRFDMINDQIKMHNQILQNKLKAKERQIQVNRVSNLSKAGFKKPKMSSRDFIMSKLNEIELKGSIKSPSSTDKSNNNELQIPKRTQFQKKQTMRDMMVKDTKMSFFNIIQEIKRKKEAKSKLNS